MQFEPDTPINADGSARGIVSVPDLPLHAGCRFQGSLYHKDPIAPVTRLAQEHKRWGFSKEVTDDGEDYFCETACSVVICFHPRIFAAAAIIRGDLTRQARHNEDLKSALDDHRRRATDPNVRQPVIYINCLINADSLGGFTKLELEGLVARLKLYIGASELSATYANKIDNARRGHDLIEAEQSNVGHRRYLSGPNHVGHQAGVRLLIERCAHRLRTEPATAWPLLSFTEIG